MYVPVPLGLFDVATDQDTCTRVLYVCTERMCD